MARLGLVFLAGLLLVGVAFSGCAAPAAGGDIKLFAVDNVSVSSNRALSSDEVRAVSTLCDAVASNGIPGVSVFVVDNVSKDDHYRIWLSVSDVNYNKYLVRGDVGLDGVGAGFNIYPGA